VKPLLLLAVAGSVWPADAPKIFYSKSFPGSVPPFVSIEVEKSGAAVFREAPDDPQPISFQLEPAETEAIFTLAAKLDYFARPLESNLKVARMGVKTLRYQAGATRNEVQFNYTVDPDGQALHDWFERMTETVEHAINLERTARFDRLGVDKALLYLQISLERNRLVAARQLLPVLDRIAKNGVYINRARERAAQIAEFIRAGGQPPPPAQPQPPAQ
jgi:hypothetical protein